LVAVLKAYAEYLDSHPTVDLRALSHTLFSRRTTFSARVSFSAKTLRELRTKMDSVTSKTATNLFVTAPVSVNPPRILGIFTGQGAQWAGMASRLMQLAGAIAVIGELERSLAELPDPPSWSLQAELSKLQSCSRVTEAAIAQPACTAIQILLVKMLRAAGIQFSAVVGHSSGEIAASYAAGYLSARDAIRIAYYRGVHLDLVGGKNGESGAMIAVGASYEEAQNLCNRDEFCGRICVAASNSASSVTLSGDSTAVDEMETLLKAQNRFARRLRVDNACKFRDK
jgi:hybrid polyketide synthase/nonribosomal peptide synthetase ACE1